MVLVLRLIHVVLGVFWAGTILFAALFLMPAIRDAGPEGGKVLGGLLRRRYFDILPAVAALTIVSGVWLYWLDSAGFNGEWIRSPVGLALGLGGVAAIVAFALGAGIMRPSTLRAFALSQALAQLPAGPERDAQQAEIQRLRSRASGAGRIVAGMLLMSVIAMAVARYL